MRFPDFKSVAILLLLALALTDAGHAGPMTLVGRHPVSILTPFPNIHSIRSYKGRVYFGYGDYFTYPVNIMVSYSEPDNAFRLEYSTGTDAVDSMRVLDGKLFVPSVDPIHYEDFRDLSYRDPVLGWRDMSPLGFLHLYDMAQLGTDLYVTGSSDVGYGMARSTNGGRNWTVLIGGGGDWCFALGTRVWTSNGYYSGSVFTQNFVFSGASLYKPTTLPAGFAVALRNRAIATSAPSATALISFDGTAVRTLAASIMDFAWDGTDLYSLASTGISRATGLTAAGATWVSTGVTVPVGARALEVVNGVAYVAAGGSVYAARLSGEPWGLATASVINELRDSFGRGLAFDGSRLLVGSPDASTATVPLSGGASVWTVPPPNSGTWSQTTTINPPTPDVSGWFGKDVATRGDLLAVVESGYDTTNSDRGSAARVHVYQLVEGIWVGRAILSVPFAHSAVFDENMLLVGTGNPAANQASGLPGVNPYLITRDAQEVPTFTAQAQLRPTFTDYGYKPIARVLRVEDRLVAGFAGDPSRSGGGGLVVVWKKAASGTAWTSGLVQQITPFNTTGVSRRDRFGFAVAGEGTSLAVGAPRDDTTASEAGRVHLYNWNGAGYVQTQIINSPVAQAEAGFGASLAMKGNKLLIGSPGLAVSNVPHVGGVYLYMLNGGTWQFVRRMQRPSGSLADFGVEVAIGDEWLAAGSSHSSAGTDITSRIAFEPANLITHWSMKNGLQGPAADPAADADLDGTPNFLEYACGLNPISNDSKIYRDGGASGLPLITPTSTPADSFLFVTYLKPVADPLLIASVEAGTALHAMSAARTEPISSVTRNGMIITKVRIGRAPGTKAYFARVRYSYPPP
jgi:FG-GAP repeat